MASVLNFIDELVEGIGPRVAGSESEYQASELIANRFEEFGLPVQVEEFDVYPFKKWFLLIADLLFVIGGVLAFFVAFLRILALALIVLGLAVVVLELLDRNPLHRILPTQLSQNVIGRYVPTGSINVERPRKVVVLAHYDTERSAIEAIPFLARRVKYLKIVQYAVMIIALIAAILLVIPRMPDLVETISRYAALGAAAVVAISLVCSLVNQFLPIQKGANCNASGVAVLYRLAEMLSTHGAMTSVSYVENTRSRSRRRVSTNEPQNYDLGQQDQNTVAENALYEEEAPREHVLPYGMAGTSSSSIPGVVSGPVTSVSGTVIPRGASLEASNAEMIRNNGEGFSTSKPSSRPADQASAVDELGSAQAANAYAGAENLVQAGTERRSPFVFDRQTVEPGPELEDLAYQSEAVEEALDDENAGVPDWYVNARKNAEKKIEQRARREGEKEVVRSRYADIPMTAATSPGQTLGASRAANTPAEAGGRRPSADQDLSAFDSPDDTIDAPIDLYVSDDSGPKPVSESPVSGEGGQFEGGQFEGGQSEDLLGATDANALNELASGLNQPSGPAGAPAANGSDRPGMAGGRAATQARSSLPQPDLSGIDRRAFQVVPSDESDESLIVPTNPDNLADLQFIEELDALDYINFPPPPEQIQLPLQESGAFGESGEGNGADMGPKSDETAGEEGFAGNSPAVKSRLQNLPELQAKPSGDSPESAGSTQAESAPQAPGQGAGSPKNENQAPRSPNEGRNRRNRSNTDMQDSPASWLGVDDDFEARKAGESIGSWDNFNDEEDDVWRGGAFGGETYEDDIASIEELSNELLDKEVWLVALGSSGLNHSGARYFLNRHERQLRGSLFMNVLGVGAGDLCFTILEGELSTNRTDQRLQSLLSQAAQELAVPIAPIAFTAFETDGAIVLQSTSRSISLLGISDGIPQNWRNKDDSSARVREDKILVASELILETIKNS
ncbi:MAG: hypothetical protein FWH40_02440 [Coriobacteriia bacterium]|nr:hypothetical protein [Coriobacteriia bacterium]